MSKKLSIRDIGKELGISITTVSFILNGKAKEKRISEALTEKVLKFVEEVNFKPNMMAQGLRTGKSKIICLMVEDISNNLLFAQVARLIEEEAHSKGYRIIYCSTDNKREKASELIRLFRDRSIDGFIITPPEGIEDEIQSLIDEEIPVVLIDRNLPKLKCNYVGIDNLNSSRQAIEHLITNGFKNIAFVSIESDQMQMADRQGGYEQAVKGAGLKTYIKKLNFYNSEEQNIKDIASFLNANKEIDAVFFSTNYIGVWGLQAIKSLQLQVPGKIGVVSFDDMDLFKFYGITVVAQPVPEISSHIIKLMLNALKEKDDKIHEIVLPAQLIIRESSTKPVSKNNDK